MRVVGIGSQEHTRVDCLDEPALGSRACHEYEIQCLQDLNGTCATINFQNGPVKESGVNGCHNEDLIVIVLDRLKCFQSGDFKCRENALAITKLEEALHWLNHRTSDRKRRGVEGLNKV